MNLRRAALLAAILAATGAQPRAAEVQWHADPVGTSGELRFSHAALFDITCLLNQVDATIAYASDGTTPIALSMTADLASLVTHSDMLRRRLLAADVLDVARYPKLTLVATSIRPAPNGYTVQADLTLHGLRRSLPFHLALSKAHVALGAHFQGATLTGSFDRRPFGITSAAAGQGDHPSVGTTFDLTLIGEFVDKVLPPPP